ncbi:hypothetical protein [Pandoraea commovens]|uniref:Uncharacterized protein n=1 Tax=Pandoraea commovens TaxID=2508289 RepID=A0ABY5Q8P9_9BURK|nr:hypothetical protein [Pandoraea commovens]UVA77136.1 hypothetical protein NTU39_00330 [Pandoraea commovens]
MLVDVIRLRRAGEKLSKADFLASRPVRGHLCSWSYGGGYRAGKQLRIQAITLTACGRASGAPLLPPLHNIRFVRFSDDGLIFAGEEAIEVRRRHDEVYRQAWFCKPIIPPESG